MGGGKRLRPAFCHWGFVAGGGDPDDPARHRRRRGLRDAPGVRPRPRRRDGRVGQAPGRTDRPPVVRRSPRRGRLARRGPPLRRGRGDPRRRPGPRVRRPAAARRSRRRAPRSGTSCASSSTSASTSTCSARPAATLDPVAARRIARYKSGKYTIERPLHLGAALAGRLADLGPALSAYGDPLGEAFQLRDDMLGVFGDEAVVGKPVGDDLREGKPTLLLAVAAERADAGRPRAARPGRHARPRPRRRRPPPGAVRHHRRPGRGRVHDRPAQRASRRRPRRGTGARPSPAAPSPTWPRSSPAARPDAPATRRGPGDRHQDLGRPRPLGAGSVQVWAAARARASGRGTETTPGSAATRVQPRRANRGGRRAGASRDRRTAAPAGRRWRRSRRAGCRG